MTELSELTTGIGSSVLYRAATGLEKAMADVDADRSMAVPAELVYSVWDPDTIDIKLLPYLAWAMGVSYWNDGWSETTKRAWVKTQWLFKSTRGTNRALKVAVDYAGRDVSPNGYSVDKITTQPQKIFSGPSLTREQREAWMQALPQVRTWRINESADAPISKSFYGGRGNLRQRDRRFLLGGVNSPLFPSPSPLESPVDVRVAPIPSSALSRMKRRVRWIENGEETDVTVTEAEGFFQLHRSAPEGLRVFSGRPFNLGRFFIPSDAWKRLITIQPTPNLAWRSPLTPTLEAVTSEPERVVVPTQRTFNVISNTPMFGAFIPSTAARRIFHRYAVLDPAVRQFRRPPVQFMGTGRYGFPSFTAEVDVSVKTQLKPWKAGLWFYQPGHKKFYIPHDFQPLREIRNAILGARSMNDKILLRTGKRRGFIAGDRPVLADIDTVIVGRPITDLTNTEA